MNSKKFYLFGSSFSRIPVGVSNKELDWDTNCKIVRGDYVDVHLPIVMKQYSGSKWTDILAPSSVSMYVVSLRFIEILENHNVTGWRTYPIQLFNKEGKVIEGFIGFSIVGRCNAFDYSQSKVYEKQLVPNGAKTKYYKGVSIELEYWDGSDFFIPKGTLNIVVSDRVKQLIERNNITNAILTDLTDYEISEFALRK